MRFSGEGAAGSAPGPHLPPLVEDAPLPDEPPSAGQRAPGAGVLDPPDACPPSAKPVAFRLLKSSESTKEISISNKKLSQRAVTVDQAGFDLHVPLWLTTEVLSACLDAAAAEPSKWDSAAIEGLRKSHGNRHLARWCDSYIWPIVRDEALPVPLLGAKSVGPSQRFCTLLGVQLVVRIAGGSGAMFRSIARVLPARGRAAGGDHAPPMDASDFSGSGEQARDQMIVWLSGHPSLLVAAAKVEGSPAADVPILFLQETFVDARPWLDILGGLLAKFTTERQFNWEVLPLSWYIGDRFFGGTRLFRTRDHVVAPPTLKSQELYDIAAMEEDEKRKRVESSNEDGINKKSLK